jgi:pheromone shutdown protein TraB
MLVVVINIIDSKNEHAFSVELDSKRYLSLEQAKNVDGPVLIEGTLGELISKEFVEGVMLELKGTRGVLRLDITESEWDNLFREVN